MPRNAPVRVRSASEPSSDFDRPKSPTLTRPSASRKQFDGLTSRWITPSLCASWSPSITSRILRTASPCGSGPSRSTRSLSVWPGISSMTMNGRPSAWSAARTKTHRGCAMALASRPSWRNRSTAVARRGELGRDQLQGDPAPRGRPPRPRGPTPSPPARACGSADSPRPSPARPPAPRRGPGGRRPRRSSRRVGSRPSRPTRGRSAPDARRGRARQRLAAIGAEGGRFAEHLDRASALGAAQRHDALSVRFGGRPPDDCTSSRPIRRRAAFGFIVEESAGRKGLARRAKSRCRKVKSECGEQSAEGGMQNAEPS